MKPVLARPKNQHRSLARANNARNALVACTVSMAFSSALRSDLTASSCSDLNSIHSTELSLVMNPYAWPTVAIETVSPFNLTLNVAFSGVSELDGSLMPLVPGRTSSAAADQKQIPRILARQDWTAGFLLVAGGDLLPAAAGGGS